MVKTIEKAKRIQQRRLSAGRVGLAKAVARFLKREKLDRTALTRG